VSTSCSIHVPISFISDYYDNYDEVSKRLKKQKQKQKPINLLLYNKVEMGWGGISVRKLCSLFASLVVSIIIYIIHLVIFV